MQHLRVVTRTKPIKANMFADLLCKTVNIAHGVTEAFAINVPPVNYFYDKCNPEGNDIIHY